MQGRANLRLAHLGMAPPTSRITEGRVCDRQQKPAGNRVLLSGPSGVANTITLRPNVQPNVRLHHSAESSLKVCRGILHRSIAAHRREQILDMDTPESVGARQS